MPYITRRCRQTACPALVQSPAKYCESHTEDNTATRRKAEYDRQRAGEEHRRIYGTVRWKRLRACRLAEHPFCEMEDLCVRRTGHAAPRTDVHHVLGVVERPDLTYEYENLKAACHECHSAHTARTEGF